MQKFEQKDYVLMLNNYINKEVERYHNSSKLYKSLVFGALIYWWFQLIILLAGNK